MAWPVLLAALATAQAVSGAVMFVMFIKEEAIQSAMMGGYLALKYNQKARAKEMYQRARDYYILDLAKTIAPIHEFDPDLVQWAGWQPWGIWDHALFYGPSRPLYWPVDVDTPLLDSNGWGDLAPYGKQAFISFVNTSLDSCKTSLGFL